MIRLADSRAVGLIAKGARATARTRGWTYIASLGFQSDRESETIGHAELAASAAPGRELTFTLVPRGSERRIGIDRDRDGSFDGDELDFGSNPKDARSTPPRDRR
jgi:hypothetical protein